VSYVAPNDVRSVLLPLADPFNNTAASMTDPQLQFAIDDATTLVDGYTGTAYEDEDVPRLVQTLTKAVAAYYATLTFRKNVALDQRDPTLLRYQDAVVTLKSIAAGEINPVPFREADPTDVPPAQVFVQNPFTGTLFTPRDFHLGAGRGCPW
jgi:phage gp36-like protein